MEQAPRELQLITLMSQDPEIYITVEAFVSAAPIQIASPGVSHPLTYRPRPPSPLPPPEERQAEAAEPQGPSESERNDRETSSPTVLLSPPVNTWKAPRDHLPDGALPAPPPRPRRPPPPVRRWSTPNTTPDTNTVIPKPAPSLCTSSVLRVSVPYTETPRSLFTLNVLQSDRRLSGGAPLAPLSPPLPTLPPDIISFGARLSSQRVSSI